MKCIVCAIIKDEQRFLKEWIDWNISIGFDALYLCEDLNSSSHEAITKDYENVVLLKYNDEMARYESGGGSYRQMAYYKWFIDHYNDDADWCAFIDVDEFIHIDNNEKIKDLLSDYDEFNGLYLYWKFYGADGKILAPSGNVQDNYKEEKEFDKDNGWRFKSIMNFRRDKKMSSVHCVDNGVNTWKIKTKRIKTYHKAHIKHYFTKSWEDWCFRMIERGDIYKSHRKVDDFFTINKDMLSLKEELMKFYEKKVADYRKQTT